MYTVVSKRAIIKRSGRMNKPVFEMKVVGKNIAKLRRETNMTQMQLAEAMQVSYQAVSSWERGLTMPDISKLPELAEVFHTSIDDLFGIGKEEPLSPPTAEGEIMVATFVSPGDETIIPCRCPKINQVLAVLGLSGLPCEDCPYVGLPTKNKI